LTSGGKLITQAFWHRVRTKLDITHPHLLDESERAHAVVDEMRHVMALDLIDQAVVS
jgi:hypothetical protein